MRFPFGQTYSVRCKDGSLKTVHRNVDHAFPLFIPGWKGDLSASAKGSAKAAAIDGVKAEIKGKYATEAQGLLFALDDGNRTCQIQFRTAYLLFATDPCTYGPFLQRQVEKIINEQHRLSRLRVQVNALMELAKNQPTETLKILSMFKEVAGQVGGAPALDAAIYEIAEARQIAGEWSAQ